MSQLSFRSISKREKKLRCEKFLDCMEKVVPWNRLLKLINVHYASGKRGRPAYSSLLMLKIHCLQQWFNLSDPAMEEAIYDRNSFQKFLQLDLLCETVPDETSILNFRHFLEEHRLSTLLFKEITKHLEEQGYIMRKGTLVDASIIMAPTSTKNKDKSRDPEMGSTKKGNNYYFGMKAHIGVDTKHALVHSLETTSANEHDLTQLGNVLHGEEEYVGADKAYTKKAFKKFAREEGVCWGVLDRAHRNRPLSNAQKKRNKKLSSVRAFVEHPFQVIKEVWGHRKTRYKGLMKNTAQLHILFGLYNVFRVRKSLLHAL